MSDDRNKTHDGYNNYRDNGGYNYQTPDNKPPEHGTPVKIYDGYGNPTDGTWSGGYVTPNKS